MFTLGGQLKDKCDIMKCEMCKVLLNIKIDVKIHSCDRAVFWESFKKCKYVNKR